MAHIHVQHGIVKFFNKDKQFGYVISGDEEYYFIYIDGVHVEIKNHDVGFSDFHTLHTKNGKISIRPPDRDDHLIFSLIKCKNGTVKAAPWTFAEDWKKLEDSLRSPTTYRVVEEKRNKGVPESEPHIVWCGSDLDELSELFPLTTNICDDPLLPYWKLGSLEVVRWWETQFRDGSWERCPDPRPVDTFG